MVFRRLMDVSYSIMSFPGGSVVNNLPANTGDTRDAGLFPGLGRFLGGGNGNSVFLPQKCNGQRSLTG